MADTGEWVHKNPTRRRQRQRPPCPVSTHTKRQRNTDTQREEEDEEEVGPYDQRQRQRQRGAESETERERVSPGEGAVVREETDRWSYTAPAAADIGRQTERGGPAQSGGWNLPPPLDDEEESEGEREKARHREWGREQERERERLRVLQEELLGKAAQREAEERPPRSTERHTDRPRHTEDADNGDGEVWEYTPSETERQAPAASHRAPRSSSSAAERDRAAPQRATRSSSSTVVKLRELPAGIETHDIRQFMTFAAVPVPTITDITIQRGSHSVSSAGGRSNLHLSNQPPTDTAFVTFSTAEEATQAVEKNGELIVAHNGRLEVEARVLRSSTTERDKAKTLTELKRDRDRGMRQTTVDSAFSKFSRETDAEVQREALSTRGYTGRNRSLHSRSSAQNKEGNSAGTAITLGDDTEKDTPRHTERETEQETEREPEEELCWQIVDGRVWVGEKGLGCGSMPGGLPQPCMRFEEEGIWLPIEDHWGNVECTIPYTEIGSLLVRMDAEPRFVSITFKKKSNREEICKALSTGFFETEGEYHKSRVLVPVHRSAKMQDVVTLIQSLENRSQGLGRCAAVLEEISGADANGAARIEACLRRTELVARVREQADREQRDDDVLAVYPKHGKDRYTITRADYAGMFTLCLCVCVSLSLCLFASLPLCLCLSVSVSVSVSQSHVSEQCCSRGNTSTTPSLTSISSTPCASSSTAKHREGTQRPTALSRSSPL